MPELNYVAVIVAVMAGLILSGVWYSLLSERLASLHTAYATSGRGALPTVVVELGRNALVALMIAGLVDRLGLSGLGDGLVLAISLWAGFPVVILAGSVFHERVPSGLAAIHCGDWLLKLLAIGGILAGWQ